MVQRAIRRSKEGMTRLSAIGLALMLVTIAGMTEHPANVFAVLALIGASILLIGGASRG